MELHEHPCKFSLIAFVITQHLLCFCVMDSWLILCFLISWLVRNSTTNQQGQTNGPIKLSTSFANLLNKANNFAHNSANSFWTLYTHTLVKPYLFPPVSIEYYLPILLINWYQMHRLIEFEQEIILPISNHRMMVVIFVDSRIGIYQRVSLH